MLDGCTYYGRGYFVAWLKSIGGHSVAMLVVEGLVLITLPWIELAIARQGCPLK